jgi:hypothetical protein
MYVPNYLNTTPHSYAGVDVQICSFLTLALDGAERATLNHPVPIHRKAEWAPERALST